MRIYHTYYNLRLERNPKRYSEINVTSYSTKHNKTKRIKPISAREKAIIEKMKEMISDLSMRSLEVKLKE